jgi:hypothetical protein
MGEGRHISTILDLGILWTEMCGQLHTSGKRNPGIRWMRGWKGHRGGLDMVEKRKTLAPTGNPTLVVQPVARHCTYWGITALRWESGICSIIIIIVSGVRLSPLGTAATTGLLYQPQMIDDVYCGEIGGIKIGRGNRSTRRKPAPAPLYPPQIPHDQTRARTRAASVGNQRLTAWAMARPVYVLYILISTPDINEYLFHPQTIFTPKYVEKEVNGLHNRSCDGGKKSSINKWIVSIEYVWSCHQGTCIFKINQLSASSLVLVYFISTLVPGSNKCIGDSSLPSLEINYRFRSMFRFQPYSVRVYSWHVTPREGYSRAPIILPHVTRS